MEKLIAIGPREQDFSYNGNFFDGSITLYGSGVGKNKSYCANKCKRINHNIFSDDQAEFIDNEAMKMISVNSNVRFMSYDPNQAFFCNKEITDRTICLNEKTLMDKMNNKITFRAWAKPFCDVQMSQLLYGYQCNYDTLSSRFNGYDVFVIQAEHSSGGEGTYILKSDNKDEVMSEINPEETYLVSGYEKYNIPLNIHAIIYNDDILLFPISIQIMQLNGIKLLYQGADFIAAKSIDCLLKKKFIQSAYNICSQLQREGYRGVTGIDAMIVGNTVRILEMNNRFQGSTILLNKALYEKGMPSMQMLNYEAFTKDFASCCLDDFVVPYSCFTYIANVNGERQRAHYRTFSGHSNVVEVLDEGLNYDYEIAPYATLERVIFNTNIVSISTENTIRVHPNIVDLDDTWINKIVDLKDLLYIKIALINQGVHIPLETSEYFENNGGMCEAVYNAIDIYLDDIVINAPINVKLSDFSPFELKIVNSKLNLYFIDEYIMDVIVRPEDIVRKQKTSSGQLVGDICLLATDRIRVQHSCNCNYVKNNVGCKFCEVENHDFSFDFNDICEAIDLYRNSSYEYRHFLIGGRTDSSDKESNEILNIAKYINKECKYPIYVMCVPPATTDILDDYYNVGVTEIAFNIEIWDRNIARSWMPGKGAIPLDNYLKMLKHAVTLWGNTGAVRTAFVVGLEPLDSLLNGIENVCKLGVAPILSVFRPIPRTVSENIIPLSNQELLNIFYLAKEICGKYGLELGPQCIPCQNNTLSLPQHLLCRES